MGATIRSSGFYVPGTPVSNEQLIELTGIQSTPEKIVELCGIEQRYFVEPEDSLANLCGLAGRLAIVRAGCDRPKDAAIDQVIVATSTADDRMPSAAVATSGLLRLGETVSSMDINLACAGFAKALFLAAKTTDGKPIKRSLVIGADVLSRVTDYSDRGTAILFGDGAGSMIVEHTSRRNGLLGYSARTIPAKDILNCPYPDKNLHEPGFLQMNGRGVYRAVMDHLPNTILDALKDANLGVEDVHSFILHQANERMLIQIADRLGIAMEKMPVEGVKTTGNTSAATIPIAFDKEYHNKYREPMIQEGVNVVFAGFGAGMCIEALVWKM